VVVFASDTPGYEIGTYTNLMVMTPAPAVVVTFNDHVDVVAMVGRV
jgi:hypothetical protein